MSGMTGATNKIYGGRRLQPPAKPKLSISASTRRRWETAALSSSMQQGGDKVSAKAKAGKPKSADPIGQARDQVAAVRGA
jgi:hypothetical protein